MFSKSGKLLLDDCKLPKVLFEDNAHSVGSKTFSPLERNQTKPKVIGKIEQFIEEYSEENLGNSVMSFKKHQLSNLV